MAIIYYALGLMGPMASGKSTVAKYLESQTRGRDAIPHQVVDSSAYLSILARSKNMKPTREVKQRLCNELEQGNPFAITEQLFKQISTIQSLSGYVIPVIDSVRTDAQVEHWKKLVRNINFVYIETDYEIRFERYNKREIEQGRHAITKRDFDKLHSASTDSNLQRLKKYAGLGMVIQNNGDIHALHHQAMYLMLALSR